MKGSCLCGEVTYEVTGEPLKVTHCHCQMCRKQHGAAFGTYVRVQSSDFRWLTGEEMVTLYPSSEGVRRGFCKTCGSTLVFEFDPMPELYFITAGTLDEAPDLRADRHIFVGSKAPWYTIADDTPQFHTWKHEESDASA